MMPALDLKLPDPGASETLGAALGAHLDSAALTVIYLVGELGAGKTTLARSLLRARGVTGLIRSPTYTLLENYEAGSLRCVHLDLYRLRSALEVEELGLRDLLEPGTLLLIEWPERGGVAVPAADLQIHLEHADDARRARVSAASRGSEWLVSKLAHDASLTPYLSN